jgi:hypothetical protein
MGSDSVFGEVVMERRLMNTSRRMTLAVVSVVLACAPAFAEMDLSGDWISYMHEDAMERGGGPFPVDYLGLPLNEQGRARALLYSASQIAMVERQCLYYTSVYMTGGPFGFKIWADTEPINGQTIAMNISGTNDRAPIKIWMDGRPHPSKYAIHPIGGFATGVWEGDVLKVYMTHMKAGYLRRNGAPTSDQTTLTTHFIRHGDLLTVIAEIQDPVYLTEPIVISRNYRLGTNPIRPFDTPCIPGEEATRRVDTVPHYLPGKNPFLEEVSKLYNLPLEAVLGGAETLYPAYRKKLKETYVPPEKCRNNCGYGGFTTGSSQ